MEAVRLEEDPAHSKTLEGSSKTVAGLRVDMRQCYRVNEQDACCDFLVTSEGKDRRAKFYAQGSRGGASRAVDNLGHVYPANPLKVGEYMTDVAHYSSSLTNILPADIPIFSKACFNKVSAEASQFVLFELLFSDTTDGSSNELIRAKIQAIPLQNKNANE
jgi:hypothetical protein